MKGPQMGIPGLDLSSLMGGISMPPPPPMSTTVDPRSDEPEEDEISDIVSEGDFPEEDEQQIKEVELPKTAPKKRGRKKKNEINL